jgi:hypothetical protein
MGASAVNAPVAGTIEYWDTVAPLWLAMNIQLSSPRIVIDLGSGPVATTAGVIAVKAPVVGLSLKPDTVLESSPTT